MIATPLSRNPLVYHAVGRTTAEYKIKIATAALFFTMIFGFIRQASGLQITTTNTDDKKGECILSADDYKVYSAVLDDLSRNLDVKKVHFVIRNSTVVDPALWRLHNPNASETNPTSSDEAVKDSELRIKTPCRISGEMKTSATFEIVPTETLEAIFRIEEGKDVGQSLANSWKKFYEAYPDSSGFWSFSTIGFNSSKTEAVVYVAHNCGVLCGRGTLFRLSKNAGQWRVMNWAVHWIS